jgi:uncharacterized protein (DUF924 family)
MHYAPAMLAPSDHARRDAILSFWFGPADAPLTATVTRWFQRDDALDAQIAREFGDDVAAAAAGEHAAWTAEPRGALALVVLLDQFTRNAFRGTPGAFAFDPQALAITQAALTDGTDRALGWLERYVLRMPLMHAEDRAVQDASVAAFAALHAEASAAGAAPAVVEILAGAVDYARRHAAIVARFGRYPHRNAILGRASTDEELAFLREPGSAF